MSVVVTGYASLDYAVRLDSPPKPDRTATIFSRAVEWPRLGIPRPNRASGERLRYQVPPETAIAT